MESNLKLLAKSKCKYSKYMDSKLKLLPKSKHKYNKIIICVGGNYVWLCQSEITRINVESVCPFAKTLSDSVVFSSPLSNLQL